MHTVAIYSFEDRMSAHRQKVRSYFLVVLEDGSFLMMDSFKSSSMPFFCNV